MKKNLLLSTLYSTPLKIPGKIRYLFAVVMSLVVFETAIAQTTRVTGTVTGVNDELLGGATVSEKGTSNATVTNNNGNFSLNVRSNAVLQISIVGYEMKEVSVNGQAVVNAKLNL